VTLFQKKAGEMKKWWWSRKWEQTRVLWLILFLHVAAILIFTRGFLLTRTELPYYSHCSDLSHSPCFSSSSSSNSSRCWTKPAVDRVVIIVLDALRHFQSLTFCFFSICLFQSYYLCLFIFLRFRFDFVAPSAFFGG
jgi:hypothetical protein